jgi:hypothetical protein
VDSKITLNKIWPPQMHSKMTTALFLIKKREEKGMINHLIQKKNKQLKRFKFARKVRRIITSQTLMDSTGLSAIFLKLKGMDLRITQI